MSIDSSATLVSPFYFGKYPARGDFARSDDHGAILQLLDELIARAMTLLSQNAESDAQWRMQYDKMAPIDVVFCGTKSTTVLVGTLSASQDTSGRRYPLITGTRLVVEQPMSFFRQATILAAPVWQQTRQLNNQTINNTDASLADKALNSKLVINNTQSASGDQIGFVSGTTLGQLAVQLAPSNIPDAAAYVRLGLIAMGLLLQPIIANGAANLNKALVLPLTVDYKTSVHIASFWLDLVAGFIQQHDIEPQILLTQQGPRWILILGFQGASADTLAGLMGGNIQSDHWVHIFDAEWVRPYIDVDLGLNRLDTYLTDDHMSLFDTAAVFKEVFLGK